MRKSFKIKTDKTGFAAFVDVKEQLYTILGKLDKGSSLVKINDSFVERKPGRLGLTNIIAKEPADYVSIVLISFVENRSYLGEQFFRECKFAGERSISPVEFFNNLIIATDFVFNEISEGYNISVKSIKGNFKIPSLETFGISLLLASKGLYKGKLFYNDVMEIQKGIIKAIEIYMNKLQSTP